MTNLEEVGWIGRWSPGIGDPSIVGWLTVALYATAAFLCWRAAQASGKLAPQKPGRALETTLWWLLSIVLCFLCINKQLDLQTAMTEFGRMLSRREGWYEERRMYQQLFIAALGIGGAFCAFLLLFITRKMSGSIKLAMAGLCMIGVFVVIRASSFHHVDQFLGSSVLGIKWNWILEISGIGIIVLAANRRLQHATRLSPANLRI